MKVLALADDATGALETGARLCEAGLAARVRFDSAPAWTTDSVVVDTESRHLPPDEAYARVRAVAQRARAAGVTHIFKKTDSTLRGPIAAEFRALLDVWPELPLIYAPAYPALGRTVRGGELFVDGLRLCETAFARDPLNPSRESSIAVLLGKTLPAGRVLVRDGERDSDLDAVAMAVRDTPCLVAGTAAMASAWAASLGGGERKAWAARAAPRRCLIVNGSLHPASREQVSSSGIPAIAHNMATDPVELGTGLAHLGRWAALFSSPPYAGDPLAVAAHLARAAAHAVRLAAPDCLIVFGGDTVFAILRELGISEAEPHAEVLPGAPASSIRWQGAPNPALLITKAGGFGGTNYLARIREILEKA